MDFYVMFTPAPGRSIEEFLPFVEKEAEHSYEIYKMGKVVELHYTAGTTMPVHSRCKADSRADMETMVAGFPMVQAGLLIPQIFELAPYEPFEKLKQERG